MNKTIALVAGALMGLAAYGAPVFAADVGVSISIGEPGFYGRIDIGDYPRPRIYYSEPVYIERGARYREPVYLRVRPGHSRNWKKYCREYGACGERVYFVNDDWYRNVYVPHYRERGGRRDGGYQTGRVGLMDAAMAVTRTGTMDPMVAVTAVNRTTGTSAMAVRKVATTTVRVSVTIMRTASAATAKTTIARCRAGG